MNLSFTVWIPLTKACVPIKTISSVSIRLFLLRPIMCQLIRRRWLCEHSSDKSSWNPGVLTDCELAVAAGIYINGDLQRCRPITTATFIDIGSCKNTECRRKAFTKASWWCHVCGVTSNTGSFTCTCGHAGCAECKLVVY
ncbi:hypothetical protein WAI453_008920 [Rhynchosporium graminicola]